MASPEKVKLYLASWLQLGRKLFNSNGQEVTFADSIINGDRYSREFETCWQQILAQKGKNFYLEGTEPTLDVLLSPAWNIFACARCSMPTAKKVLGIPDPDCSCVDLPSWPNLDLPLPRPPVNSNSQIEKIKNRLLSKSTAN